MKIGACLLILHSFYQLDLVFFNRHQPAPSTLHHSQMIVRVVVMMSTFGVGFIASTQMQKGQHFSRIPDISTWEHFQRCLVLLYICTDLASFAVSDAVPKSYIREAAMLATAFLSWVVGVAGALAKDGKDGLMEAMSLKHAIALSPISVCFSVALWGQLNALARLESVMVKVLFQMKLPVTVMMSTILLGRHYNRNQINALLQIFLATVGFTSLKVDEGDFEAMLQSGYGSKMAQGFLYTGVAIGMNVLGCLLAEKAFVDCPNRNFYTTMAHLKVGEMVLSLFMLSFAPGAPVPVTDWFTKPYRVLEGFDRYAWLVVLCLVADSWTSAFVVRHLSSVVKVVSKCLSLIILYMLSVMYFKTDTFKLAQMILAMLVVQGVASFSQASHKDQDPKQDQGTLTGSPSEQALFKSQLDLPSDLVSESTTTAEMGISMSQNHHNGSNAAKLVE